MNMMTKCAALLTIALGVASCAPTDCDPATGGFIGGIRCDASGGYEQRIQAREDQHAALLTRKAELIREQQQAQADRQQASAQLRKKQAEQQKARAELAAVQGQLAGARKDDQALQQRAQALEQDIATAKSEMDELAEAEQRKVARINELEAEQKALDAEYRAVTGGR
jgi:chromosome segregation ATPase